MNQRANLKKLWGFLLAAAFFCAGVKGTNASPTSLNLDLATDHFTPIETLRRTAEELSAFSQLKTYEEAFQKNRLCRISQGRASRTEINALLDLYTTQLLGSLHTLGQ